MENALLVGLSRQMVLERELDVVANNIANLNTTGFKADNSMFEEFLMPVARENRFKTPDRQMGFVNDRGTWHDFRAGSVQQTGNPLDVAIDGNAFLVVQTPPANATPATARCRSTRKASSSPRTDRRWSATAGRSSSSRPTAMSRSRPTGASR